MRTRIEVIIATTVAAAAAAAAAVIDTDSHRRAVTKWKFFYFCMTTENLLENIGI